MICDKSEHLRNQLGQLIAYVDEAKREAGDWYYTGLPLPELVKMMREALDATKDKAYEDMGIKECLGRMKTDKVEKTETGALNPVIDTRMDKLPPKAILMAARVLKHGMKYEREIEDNWRGVPADEHLNHALRHIFQAMAGDNHEDHVAHAVARILMWAELT